jgi:threonine dehydratase
VKCSSFPSLSLSLSLIYGSYDVAIETPLQKAFNLSSKLGNLILLKREDLQPVFSFKCRGAHNKMAHLTAKERDVGVVACSAGNHAQGVALAASKMNMSATIVMPSGLVSPLSLSLQGTPGIKWKNVYRLGAKVVLYGNDFEDSKQECARLCREQGLIDIPPYDDPLVIAGQGTIAVEILRQFGFYSNPRYDFTKINAIFVCVGGGGLISGIAAYVKRIYPKIKIIGVETFDADAMTQSLMAGERVSLSEVGLFADGAAGKLFSWRSLAVRTVGEETFRICKSYVDEMVLVTTDELCAAIKDVFEDTRAILEPAGALAVAGAKKYIHEKGIVGGTFVTTCSGANMNFDRLRFVAERAGFGENTEALLCVVIPEMPSRYL